MYHIQVGPVCIYTMHQATGELHPTTSYLTRVQPWPSFAYVYYLAPQESAYGFLRVLLTIFPRTVLAEAKQAVQEDLAKIFLKWCYK